MVVLVRSRDGRTLFLSAGPVLQEGSDSSRTRPERFARRLQAALLRTSRQAGPKARRVRNWLNHRVAPDETMLAGFRRAEWLCVQHPTDLGPDEVGRRWTEYLRDRQTHHLRRLALNLVFLPLTLLMAPIPGPNIIGYWFLYRAILHGMVLHGLRRATSRALETTFLADPALDHVLETATFDKVLRAAARHRGAKFEALLHEALGAPTATRPPVETVSAPATPPPAAVSNEPWHPWLSIIPNGLTTSRLVLAVLFPIVDQTWWLTFYLVSAATEALDGALSRTLHATTLLGRILDPIADKLFVVAVLATLWRESVLAGWMVPLIAGRDLLVLLGSLWVVPWEGVGSLRRMPPTWLGKVATTAQFLFLLLVIVRGQTDPWSLSLTACLSLAAGIDYIRRFR